MVALLAFGAILVPTVGAAALPESAASLLRNHAGFTAGDVAAARQGERIVRMLPSQSRAEVAFAGVIRLPIPFDEYVRRVRAGKLYKTNEILLQVGRFGETPSVEDLRSLRFERYDLNVKDDSPGSIDLAAKTNKQFLTQTVAEYEQTGRIFTGPLGSEPQPVNVGKYFDPMVTHVDHLRERYPAAFAYLLRYPNVPKRGPDDYYLWKQLTFGLRPLTRLAQVGIWEQQRDGIREAVVVTKQIYANRYFDASFQIDYVFADFSEAGGGPAVFVITFNRGASGFLEGQLGRVIRPIVVSRTKAAAEKTLDEARSDMEAEFGRKVSAATDNRRRKP